MRNCTLKFLKHFSVLHRGDLIRQLRGRTGSVVGGDGGSGGWFGRFHVTNSGRRSKFAPRPSSARRTHSLARARPRLRARGPRIYMCLAFPAPGPEPNHTPHFCSVVGLYK